jgi:predicted HTH transcriptional regulator
MSFPTTEMAGHTDLKERLVLALGRCQEEAWLDFKESQPWPVLQWRLLKTMMGMANLRDGGLILVGISERDTTWECTGIDPNHLVTFDYDDIIDKLGRFASPQVRVDIVIHDHEDKHRYLAINVRPFTDTPVVCRNSSPDSVKGKERLCAADFYVRPGTGKPRTERANDASVVHDLLEQAAEFRARRMLESGRKIGLVPGKSAAAEYDAELPASLKGLFQ